MKQRLAFCRAGTLALAASLAIGLSVSSAADWPTYQHDNARSGVTTEELAPPLAEAWVFVPKHPPSHAWGDPQPKPVEGNLELPRVRFDDVFHVAAVDDAIYFGSSSDNKVYCLDAATGRIRWEFCTLGPVRLAPTVWEGKVFVASDDGHVYCLRADDGKLEWKFRAAPHDDRVLGHGKLVSLWPLRTGVLIDNGVAYFTAGIFPAEGLYLYALRIKDRKLLWKNDSFGQTGHGMSPQGYMLTAAENLFIPSGRAAPAGFDRKDGRFLYQGRSSWRRDGLFGGTYALVADDRLYSGTEQVLTFDGKTGKTGFAWFHGRRLIVTTDYSYMLTDTEMSALDRRTYPEASRQRQDVRRRRYRLTGERRKVTDKLKPIDKRTKGWRREIATLDRQLDTLRKARKTESREFLAAAKAREDLDRKLAEAEKTKEPLAEQMAEFQRQFKALDEEGSKAQEAVGGTVTWRTSCECPDSMILAGRVLVAGGKDRVIAVDSATGDKLWTANVSGRARGLAVANGRLLVSTDSGHIHCFSQTAAAAQGAGTERISQPANPNPYPRDGLSALYDKTANAIINETGIRRGYCLILGGGTGRLAFELAKRTELMIYVVEEDERKVEAARRALTDVGMYGARVCVEQLPLSRLPYPDYFANLIVCEKTFLTGELPMPSKELLRMLKPLGGVAYVGQPSQAKGMADALDSSSLQTWLKDLRGPNVKVSVKGGVWAKITRGALKGAGSWTHQYADAGNTTCGDDLLVKCPLGILWFGEPGPGRMPSRHASAAAPLSIDGRLFVQGENVIMAYDAYNGLLLWERNIPGAMRLGTKGECSNLAASKSGLFAAIGNECLRLDPATGVTRQTYSLPQTEDRKPRQWGYVACVGNRLFGTRKAGRNVADSIFALDIKSGKRRWQYNGASINHNTIAIGGDRVFLSRSGATTAQRNAALKARASKRRGVARKSKAEPKKADVRLIVALDAATGKKRWEKAIDVSDCVKISKGHGDLSAIYSKGVLVLFGTPWNGHFWKEFFAGEFSRRSIIALSAKTGKLLWSGKIGYRSRPFVIGDTIYAEPWAHDLRTGRPKMRKHPITGKVEKWQISRPGHHCGCIAACPSTLFFRSGTIAYYDLIGDCGTTHFPGQRTGCWINFIPANGLVLIPEASSGCVCPFPIHCTVVLRPRETDRGWGMSSAPGLVTPVKRLAINLGAPGDRRDAEGTLWTSYPRPGRGRLVLALKLGAKIWPGGGYYRQNVEGLEIRGTEKPWVFASGCVGLTHCDVPLVGEGEAPGVYTVRLGFIEPVHDAPGERVFDIKLQDRLVRKDFDIVKQAGARNTATIQEFEGVEAMKGLRVELVPTAPNPTKDQTPLLNSIEVIRTKTIAASFVAPSFLLSDFQLAQTGEVKLVNFEDKTFVGVLQAEPPPGFRVQPGRVSVRIPAKGEKTIKLEAEVTKKMKAGAYEIGLKLTRRETVESDKVAQVAYEGGRREIALKAVEDAIVRKGRPRANQGSGRTLAVDGGAKEFEDSSYTIALLRFRLDVPGEPLSAKFRIRVGSSGHAQSRDAGRVFLVKGRWQEKTVTFENRPELAEQIGTIGKVGLGELVERELAVSMKGRKELSIAIVPTANDGATFISREGEEPPVLVVKYEGRQ